MIQKPISTCISEYRSLLTNKHDFSNEQDTHHGVSLFFLISKIKFASLTNQHLTAFPKHVFSPHLPLIVFLDQEEQIWVDLQTSRVIVENVLTYAETIINIWHFLTVTATVSVLPFYMQNESRWHHNDWRCCAGWLSLFSPWTNLWKKGVVGYWSSVPFWG